jgi:hypothetical protein
MKFLDKIALNRLIKTVLDFFIKLAEMFQKKNKPDQNKPDVKPDRKPILPWRRKKKENETNN